MPKKRFTDWSALSAEDTAIAENDLGYIKYSWNVVGENDIETWAYSDLYTSEAAAVSSLGISEEQWDCWVNHYKGYYWSSLESMGITTHLDVLGWNEAMWDGDGTEPSSEQYYWAELSAEQQEAAKQICYIEELWDGVPLKQWG